MGTEHTDENGNKTFTFPRGNPKVTPKDPEPNPNTKVYAGHTITLDHNWFFEVSGPEFDQSKYSIKFKSLQDARDEIDKRKTDTSKIEAKKVSIHLIVLDEHGERCVIERINRTTSEVSGVTTDLFYPNVEWIREALSRRRKLQSEIATISDTLKKFQVSKSMGYGRIDTENYALRVEKLRNEFQEKTREALNTKLEAVGSADNDTNDTPNSAA
jgi:hypothetical protein